MTDHYQVPVQKPPRYTHVVFRKHSRRATRRPALAALPGLLAMLYAVLASMPSHALMSEQSVTALETTPALDLSAFSSVEDMVPQLEGKRVVFVGEQHTRYDHHLVQLEIIRRLHAQDPRLAIGLEMFQQPFQSHLDAYVAGTIGENEMLQLTEYYQRWRTDYRLYAPILRFAREQQLPLVALNLPVELTRKVGQVGLDGLTDEERRALPADIEAADPAYEQRVRDVFAHHPNDNGQEFEHFLQVQLAWDEGMAESAAAFLRSYPQHRLVILAGNAHLAYGTAIPDRLARRLSLDSVVILNSWSGAIEPGLADFLLFPTEQVLPATGKMGALLEEDDTGLTILACMEDSVCAAAGMRDGDRIVSIDDAAIGDMADLRLAMWNKQPGDSIRVNLVRKRWFGGEKKLNYELTLQ